jgi:hypothetical protein
MTARSFARAGRPMSILLGAALVALLTVMLLAGTAVATKPAAPTAKSPSGTISTATPTFTWSKVLHATKYEVRVYSGSQQVLKKQGLAKPSWKSATALPTNVSLTWKVRAGNAAGNGAWSTSLAFTVAPSIGDVYQGGKIAYILENGDPGYDPLVTHGLIAATADQSTGVQWYNGSYVATGATGTALGTGSANTDAIIAAQGTPVGGYAAGVARAYRGGGYTDWYLPSKDELNELFLHQAAIGGFGPHYYWSSSEYDANTAWNQAFDLSSQYANPKTSPSWVRAVRAF